ncbi:MAG TPA: non-canonical purine NTP pyrophosphatase [Rubrivivax sp.]|nr:non-canonical purine NTP pyrophosphatase [Rubrivivax sp.]
MRLVLASNNAGKLSELRALFAALPVELVAQPSLGLAEAEEPHPTFVENALAKARHAARATGAAALADDSGLCVDALGGAPGVISAHFADLRLPDAGREAQRKLQDAANNRLLLQRLGDAADRRASFVCTLVALRSADDPQPLIATGRWQGEILRDARGAGGFGYDPLMFIPALGASVAELPGTLKNLHSHRSLACRQMLQLMHEAWCL